MTTWAHPKITPFHLTFIVTTGGLGIAKAVLVSKGDTALSITVEWITGVVVALILQFLGSCECNDSRPECLDWYFGYNCLGRGTEFGAANPRSIQPEITLNEGHGDSARPPLVTAFRLLISVVFVSFGLAKMFCGYIGLSSAMSALDWTIAVPLTISTYYFGLYEETDNDSPTLRKLFRVSYASQIAFTLQTACLLAIYVGIIALCGLWLKFWFGGVRDIMVDTYFRALQDDNFSSHSWNTTARSTIFVQSLAWTAAAFCMAMFAAGLLIQGGLLWPIIHAVSSRRARFARYHGLLTGFVSLYSSFALICAAILLVAFFVGVSISTLSLWLNL